MHHLKPSGMVQQDILRTAAVKVVSAQLSRSEPPLRQEVVTYMLHADSHMSSMRKLQADWLRIINEIAGVIDGFRWIDYTFSWKNSTGTLLVRAFFVMLVSFPDLIVPTLAFYVFVIGAWNYRFHSKASLLHFDTKISLTVLVDRDELDEEFDAMSCMKPEEMVRGLTANAWGQCPDNVGRSCDTRRACASIGDMAGFACHGDLCGIMYCCGVYLVFGSFKMMAMAFGFYYLRHPIIRDRMPSPALNFFQLLPSLVDRML